MAKKVKTKKSKANKSNGKFIIILLLVAAVVMCAIFTKGFTDFNPFCWFGHNFINGSCTKCHAMQTASAAVNSLICRRV